MKQLQGYEEEVMGYFAHVMAGMVFELCGVRPHAGKHFRDASKNIEQSPAFGFVDVFKQVASST